MGKTFSLIPRCFRSLRQSMISNIGPTNILFNWMSSCDIKLWSRNFNSSRKTIALIIDKTNHLRKEDLHSISSDGRMLWWMCLLYRRISSDGVCLKLQTIMWWIVINALRKIRKDTSYYVFSLKKQYEKYDSYHQ
jgi:hypothetical protein